jgi:hypothetical protein
VGASRAGSQHRRTFHDHVGARCLTTWFAVICQCDGSPGHLASDWRSPVRSGRTRAEFEGPVARSDNEHQAELSEPRSAAAAAQSNPHSRRRAAAEPLSARLGIAPEAGFEGPPAGVPSPGNSRRSLAARFAGLRERPDKTKVENASLRRAAFDAMPAAQVVLDRDDKLLLATELGRRMFALTNADLGRPIKNLNLFSCPIELAKHLDRLHQEHKPIEIKRVCWCNGTEDRVLDVRMVPLGRGHELVGTSVSYEDVTELCRLERQLEETRHALERAYYELGAMIEQFEIQLEETTGDDRGARHRQ